MPDSRTIERKWIENFKRCALVDQETGSFISTYANQLFYGRLDDSYPADYPHNFTRFYSQFQQLNREVAIDQLLTFLHFAGINISKQNIAQHLDKYPDDFIKIAGKCRYIFKALAHYDATLNINNPYRDNPGDILFLSRIEAGESTKGGQLNLFEDMELPDLYRRLSHLPDNYSDDEISMDLFRSVENSNESFFITGKAGTGKSTFIHYFTKNTHKKVLMMAFTGIAAMNIGGQTIHSFFRFPLKPLLPEDHEIKIFPKSSQQYKIIEKIDTIVIDEVSMLRSDILEAIDFSLRQNGGNPRKIFGGKQLLFVGDIFQLPPVLSEAVEGIRFNELYRSEYFFDAHSYKKLAAKYFEFKISHRQKDDIPFIRLLDKVRVCEVDNTTLALLNERYDPDYVPRIDEFVINLTANNAIANAENAYRLRELPYTQLPAFEAVITGEFPESKYPTGKTLELKKNAQIIFIKNDTGKKWVNGTIAKIDFITKEFIEVRLQDGSIHQLEKETWENRKYTYDKDRKRIVSTVLGTFEQYPVKLAWAITIHKSQGLTFDNVIIDLGRGAFINGQVYTALSRCRTLNGITLKQKLRKEDIIADQRIIQFHYTEQLIHELDDADEVDL